MHTSVEIGKIDMGLLNRIIINNVKVNDQSGREMLKASRLSAKFDLLSLLEGKISIASVQFFGFDIRLNKQTPRSPTNFQFVIDAFASKDTTKKSSPIDLRINSILLRRGRLSWDILSAPTTPAKFNAQHIALHNIIASLSLKALNKDSLNANIKRLSADEQSGLSLKKLSLHLVANKKKMLISNFTIELPQTALNMDTIRFSYDSLACFKHFTDKVSFSLRIPPSSITLSDIASFVPAFSHFSNPVKLAVTLNGTINRLNCPSLSIYAGNDIKLAGQFYIEDLLNPKDTYIYSKLSNLSVTSRGIGLIAQNLGSSNAIPPLLQRIGDLYFKGEVSGYFNDLVTYGVFHTGIGMLQTDLKLSKKSQLLSYSGTLKALNFDMGRLLNAKQFGKTTFNLQVSGSNKPKSKPNIFLKGIVAELYYSNYLYKNITLDGEYKSGGVQGSAKLNDANGMVSINGKINLTEKIPTFNFLASVSHFRPHRLNLTKDYKDVELSVNINANFRGGNIDQMEGDVKIDSFAFVSPQKSYYLSKFYMHANRIQTNNHLKITSDFMDATVDGHFHYHTLPMSLMNILHQYIPSLVMPGKQTKATNNDFVFNAQIKNTDMLPILFNFPLKIDELSTLKGYINDQTQQIHVEGFAPLLHYENKQIEQGVLYCENSNGQLNSKVHYTEQKEKEALNVALSASAQNDKVSATVSWGNNAASTFSGRLAAIASFIRHQSAAGSKLQTVINIQPSDVILNDTLWQIHPSQVDLDSDRVDIRNFYFSSKDRYIRANGRVSANAQDTLKIGLKDVDLSYVFAIADVTDDVFFGGDVTGTAYLNNLQKKPGLSAQLFIKNFTVNNGLLGDLNVKGHWDDEKKGVYLDGLATDHEKGSMDVKGYIFPLKPNGGLDLHIDANRANIKFVQTYLTSITQQIDGRGTGKVHFWGKFKTLNLDGAVMTNAKMRFDILNTSFNIQDTIHLSPEGVSFNHARLTDLKGNNGIVNGFVHFEHFKNLRYLLDVQTHNMLVLNTPETHDFPFFGTIYATGNAHLQGNSVDGLDANLAMTTNRNSTFTYNSGTVQSAANTQYIKFADKTPKRNIQDSVDVSFNHYKEPVKEEGSAANIRLNILIDATPDATVKIIMDPNSGDYISGKGTGSLRTEFYNKGDVKLFGNYNIQQGIYKFSLQEVIRKDFNIKNGSMIAFNGNPSDANLNIQAYYTVPSASLNDLIPEASTIVQQPNVKVNCLMNITGNLLRPTLKFGIELPNERDEVQSMVRNYINTDEQMNMQILYLLSIGKFYTENNTGNAQSSDMMSSVLSSTLSGQLNNMLSHVINNNNWNIGTNLSTGQKGWSEMEWEGILSGQLLNNRLLINGNFGYRENPLANTNFVGDFEAEWLLNRSGDIRLKAYNKTNDRYYTKTNLTTQGIGIIFRKEFDKWDELFFWKHWLDYKNKAKKKEKVESTTPKVNR